MPCKRRNAFSGFRRNRAEGACGYSVHPIFAVSDKKNSYREIGKAYFTVEGSSEKMYVIEELFARLGNGYQVIGAENKAKYHASLVMSSNLVIGLYHMAASLLCECWIFGGSGAGRVETAVSQQCRKTCAGWAAKQLSLDPLTGTTAAR